MATGILFFEEYFNYMDDLTPEQYCQLMRLIRDLRFKGIDAKPEDIQDKDLRLVWRSVRPSVMKSRQNRKDYDGRKGKTENNKQPIEPQEPEIDIDNFDFSPMEEEMRNVIPINPQPQEVETIELKKPAKERFLECIKNGGTDVMNEYQIFDKYWSRYYTNIETAKTEVKEYLRKFKIYKTF